jgi:hypothetical protein
MELPFRSGRDMIIPALFKWLAKKGRSSDSPDVAELCGQLSAASGQPGHCMRYRLGDRVAIAGRYLRDVYAPEADGLLAMFVRLKPRRC